MNFLTLALVTAATIASGHVVDVQVSMDSTTSPTSLHSQEDPNRMCWRTCHFNPPECPKGWYAGQYAGDCWTCCHDLDKDESAAALNIEATKAEAETAAHTGVPAPEEEDDVCWYACYISEPDCGAGWFTTQTGDCWGCCNFDTAEPRKVEAAKKKQGPMLKEQAPKSVTQTSENEMTTTWEPRGTCWMLCYSEPYDCPEGLYSSLEVGCWTCCLPEDETTKAQKLVAGAEL